MADNDPRTRLFPGSDGCSLALSGGASSGSSSRSRESEYSSAGPRGNDYSRFSSGNNKSSASNIGGSQGGRRLELSANSPIMAEAKSQAQGYRTEASHLRGVLAAVLGEFHDADTMDAAVEMAQLCQLLAVSDPHSIPSAVTHLSTRAWHCQQLLQQMKQTQAGLQARAEEVAALAECVESWKAQLPSDDDISRATDDVADRTRRMAQEQQQLSLQRSAAQGSLEAASYSADVDMAALLQLAEEVQGEEEAVGRLQQDLAIYSDLPTDITLAHKHLARERERLRALSKKLQAWSMGEIDEGEGQEGYVPPSPGEEETVGAWGMGDVGGSGGPVVPSPGF
ncbi:hypothetical protein CLOM_g6541 [Closterium sp. NIES-68]|nr:hypothetical protein CLOM_g6541 [Closterium sp. NIES-68]GJP75678.1 hypothetical protein CLOP_g6099 [Closterium sp. NIES-67]